MSAKQAMESVVAVAGISAGEYAALVLAGSLTFDDGSYVRGHLLITVVRNGNHDVVRNGVFTNCRRLMTHGLLDIGNSNPTTGLYLVEKRAAIMQKAIEQTTGRWVILFVSHLRCCEQTYLAAFTNLNSNLSLV